MPLNKNFCSRCLYNCIDECAHYLIQLSQNLEDLNIVADDTYYLEKRCPNINRIMDVAECEIACARLQIPLSGRPFKDGKPCFRGGNGVCNQNGAHGGRSNLVCKREGIHYKALDTVVLHDNVLFTAKMLNY